MAESDFAQTYLGRLRARVGSELLLSPGAQVVLVRRDGSVLVQRRSDSGRWELPAGSCEPGQSFRTAAVAELREETGIDLAPTEFIPFATLSDPEAHTLTYPNGDRVHAFAMCFWADAGNAEWFAADGEALEHRWVQPDEIPQPAHGPAVLVLEKYLAYLEYGAFQAD